MRVQITSHASAVSPDSAITTYTAALPRDRHHHRIVFTSDVHRVRRPRRDRHRRGRHGNVDRDGHVGRNRDVVERQQVEAGEQAAQHRAGGVAAVEESEPRDAVRRLLHPARDGRQRRAHQQRRRQQTNARGHAAQQNADHAGTGPRRVGPADDRHAEQDQQSHDADADLEPGIHPQRMRLGRHESRQQEAAEAHAAHERAEQHAHRHRRRSDHEFQQLKPDDFVNECGATAADKQQQ